MPIQDNILKQVHDYVFEEDELASKLESFVETKAKQINISEIENRGLSLQVSDIHQEYQQLFESLLEVFIAKCGSSIEELYGLIKAEQDNETGTETNGGLLLGTLLLSCVDFDIFLTTILDSARRQEEKK